MGEVTGMGLEMDEMEGLARWWEGRLSIVEGLRAARTQRGLEMAGGERRGRVRRPWVQRAFERDADNNCVAREQCVHHARRPPLTLPAAVFGQDVQLCGRQVRARDPSRLPPASSHGPHAPGHALSARRTLPARAALSPRIHLPVACRLARDACPSPPPSPRPPRGPRRHPLCPMWLSSPRLRRPHALAPQEEKAQRRAQHIPPRPAQVLWALRPRRGRPASRGRRTHLSDGPRSRQTQVALVYR